MAKPINILFITADQWRGDCLSALGHPVVKTPNLDDLAADGVLFSNHFAQCAPCGPSRASILTGMYMMNHRSVRNGKPLDARFSNIALEARAAGYEPGLIGFTDTSPDPRQYHANDQALRGYGGVMSGFTQLVPGSEASSIGSKPWLRYLAAKGYDIPEGAGRIYDPVTNYPGTETRGPSYAPPIYRAEDSDTAFSIDQAVSAIARQAGRPWFLHLSLLRPHPPFIAPEPYNEAYHPDDAPGFRRAASPEIEANSHPYAAYMGRHHWAQEGLDPEIHPREDRAMRQLRATYYGLMTELDHHLGRLIGFLKRCGAYDNTLIVFTSDHGEQLWDHWVLGKQSYFDQSFHIPLIIRAPGGAADRVRGRVVEAFSESIDIMPTVLDMLDHDIPLQCDGASLGPFLADQNPEGWRTEVHWELDFRDVVHGKAQAELGIGLDDCSLTVIRDKRYKYVHFAALPQLFFDLERDPGECDNLATDPDHASRVLTYAQKMLSWRLTHAERTLTGIRLTSQGPIEFQRAER
jgi:arylsulfatase A-like enzyme